jgi:hypothetical protein
MFSLVFWLYIIGGALSFTGVVLGFFSTIRPACRYKRALARRNEIQEGYRARIKGEVLEDSGAEVWKSRQMEADIGGGRTINQVLNALSWAGDKPRNPWPTERAEAED